MSTLYNPLAFQIVFPEAWRFSDTMETEAAFSYLLIGLIGGVILLVVTQVALAMWQGIRRRKRSIIHIPGEHGDFYLMPRAVSDFVYYTLDEFRQVTIRHVYVLGTRSGYRIRLDIDLAPYTNFRVNKEEIASKVTEDLRELMGVTAPLEVEVNVLRNDADTRSSS